MTPDPTGHPFDAIRAEADDMEAERRAKAGNTITDAPWHIHSPIPGSGGRGILCGAPSERFGQYDGLDEAYRARVGGWNCGPPCSACLEVAMIAMKGPTHDE